MDIRKLQRLVIDALEDVKAQDIRLYNTTGLTDLFDRVIIASGTSNRQTKALAASVRDKVKKAGGDMVSMEGEETGEWVLVDLGDLVVHIMQPTIRSYYNLEEIWGIKPVSLKSSDAEEFVVPKSKTTKPATKKAAAKKAPVKKKVAKSATAKLAVARKRASSKTAKR